MNNWQEDPLRIIKDLQDTDDEPECPDCRDLCEHLERALNRVDLYKRLAAFRLQRILHLLDDRERWRWRS